jgi:hypothetical protein
MYGICFNPNTITHLDTVQSYTFGKPYCVIHFQSGDIHSLADYPEKSCADVAKEINGVSLFMYNMWLNKTKG